MHIIMAEIKLPLSRKFCTGEEAAQMRKEASTENQDRENSQVVNLSKPLIGKMRVEICQK
jgi:hypothetical protein